jgi:dolichol-phosphate mannosyltransferase
LAHDFELKLAVVCPMANEGASGVAFVRAVLQECKAFREVLFFVVLDNATTDNSLALLEQLARAEPRLHVVWAPENRSVVDAYVRGYRAALAAGADWILELDAGFSHQPADMPLFFSTMARGYDCVFGSRFMPGGSFDSNSRKRYLVSRGGTILTNLLLGTKQTDMTSGFELFSRSALEVVLAKGIHSQAHFFQTEIKVHCRNLRIAEVPIRYRTPSPRLGSDAITESFYQLWRLFKLRCAGRL